MLSKNSIKFIHSLTVKKYRSLNGMFIAEGPKIVGELAESNLVISEIFALQEWIDKNTIIASKIKTITCITEQELSKISSLSTPNQVVALVSIPERSFDMAFATQNMIIALDDIRDPGNLGTIIRIADWFGLKHILCSETCVDAYNPKTVQASMGSISRVNIYYENLSEILANVDKTIAIYGAFLEGNPIYTEPFARNGFMVIGNEANGISNEIAKCITHKISIPAGTQSELHAESLNASIATAIICSEYCRQMGLD